jgi:hypothetical protein
VNRLRGTRLESGPRRRLAISILALAFLGVHHVYTPIHLLAEDHLQGGIERPERRPGVPVEAWIGGGAPTSHEPHPESDHRLTGATPRLVAKLDISPVGSADWSPAAPARAEPRTRPAPVPLLRPRPPPETCLLHPRAPPAA